MTQEEQEAATRALVQRIKLEKASVDPAVVQMHVSKGARVMCRVPELWKTILTTFIEMEAAACVEACFQTMHPIDFTAVDQHQDTILHLICKSNHLDAMDKMLRAAVERLLQARKGDIVDYTMKNCDGHDFLSCAASCDGLSIAWPLVKQLPYFAERAAWNPIVITTEVMWADWNQIKDDHGVFKLQRGVSNPTGSLLVVVDEMFPSWEAAQLAVHQGADVLFRKPFAGRSILHQIVYRELVECFVVCMETKRPIDWTVLDNRGNNPLHIICLCSAAKGKAMLTAAVERLRTHPEDTVDWQQEDNSGDDFIACAAATGMLHCFWPVVKSLPYFASLPEKKKVRTKEEDSCLCC